MFIKKAVESIAVNVKRFMILMTSIVKNVVYLILVNKSIVVNAKIVMI